MVMLQMVNNLIIKQNPQEQPDRPLRPLQPPVTTLNVDVTIPLKYLSDFLRSLDLKLISREVELDLSWSKDCALIEENSNVAGVNFVITRTKLYVPVVTLSINDKINFWKI